MIPGRNILGVIAKPGAKINKIKNTTELIIRLYNINFLDLEKNKQIIPDKKMSGVIKIMPHSIIPAQSIGRPDRFISVRYKAIKPIRKINISNALKIIVIIKYFFSILILNCHFNF